MRNPSGSSPAAESIPDREPARRAGLVNTLKPLAIDILLPIAMYYVLTNAFGVPLVVALAGSSVLPLVRTVSGLVRTRQVNLLAALMVIVNLGGIGLSFVTGDARLMIAKDSGISSVIALTMLWSAVRGRPVMAAALEPYLTKGRPQRVVAWQRLSAESPQFRRYLAHYTMIWGFALLAECVARTIGVFTLPVSTMVWLSTVLVITSVAVGILFGGVLTVPMDSMLTATAHPQQEESAS